MSNTVITTTVKSTFINNWDGTFDTISIYLIDNNTYIIEEVIYAKEVNEYGLIDDNNISYQNICYHNQFMYHKDNNSSLATEHFVITWLKHSHTPIIQSKWNATEYGTPDDTVNATRKALIENPYYVYYNTIANYEIIAFNNIFAIDIDTKDSDLFNKALNVMNTLKDKYTFMVYETMSGYHIMIINSPIFYSIYSEQYGYYDYSKNIRGEWINCDDLVLLTNLADDNYRKCCERDGYYGFRTTPKDKYDNDYVARHLYNIGNLPIDKDIEIIINKYNELISRYH